MVFWDIYDNYNMEWKIPLISTKDKIIDTANITVVCCWLSQFKKMLNFS